MVIKPGVYRHYKGKNYLVIGQVVHSETREQMVLYSPRYDTDEGLVVRPLDMFTEEIEYEGVLQPRFTFVSGV